MRITDRRLANNRMDLRDFFAGFPTCFVALRFTALSLLVGVWQIGTDRLARNRLPAHAYQPTPKGAVRALSRDHCRLPAVAVMSASHHHNVGNAVTPNFGKGSGRPKRSQRALRTLP